MLTLENTGEISTDVARKRFTPAYVFRKHGILTRASVRVSEMHLKMD